MNLNIIPLDQRISPCDYSAMLSNNVKHTLLDVRERIQFDICALPNAMNIPYDELSTQHIIQLKGKIVVMCRRGNDSQLAVNMLKKAGVEAVDVIGGLVKWTKDVDADFPTY